MTSPELVVTRVLADHHPVFDESGHINGTVPGRGAWDCFCGGPPYNATFDAVSGHVAAVVIEQLGLTEEQGARDSEGFVWFSGDPVDAVDAPVHRFVTSWVEVDGSTE